MGQIGKSYFAFISYKREDEKWAKWLHHKLEHYHFSNRLRGANPALPRVIRPVFRDVEEMAGGILSERIETALSQSNYLIVVCSPRAAQSPWVNKEIDFFIKHGKEKQIIPFIIEGKPYSDNVDSECFPLGLRELTGQKELLGIHVNDMGRDAAVVKIIAQMFELNFDDLWQREKREKTRNRMLWFFASCLVAAIGIAIGLGFQRQARLINTQYVRIQNDSIALARKNINIAIQRDSLAKQGHQLLLKNDSLEKTRLTLETTNQKLVQSNQDLKASKVDIIARNHMLEMRQLTLLCSMANEARSMGQLAKCRLLLCKADSTILALGLNKIPQVFEDALRRYDDFWQRGGIERIASDSLPIQVGLATFNSPEDVVACGVSNHDNSIHIARLNAGSGLIESHPYSPCPEDNLLLLSQNQRADKIILLDDGQLIVKDTNNNLIGKPIDVHEILPSGFRYMSKYELSPSGSFVVFNYDNKIYLGNYEQGKVRPLFQAPSRIISFSVNPKNEQLIALLDESGWLYVYDMTRQDTIHNKCMGKLIHGITYHPDGFYLLAYGNGDILLLNSSLEEYKPWAPYMSSAAFNPTGDRIVTFETPLLGSNSVYSFWKCSIKDAIDALFEDRETKDIELLRTRLRQAKHK